MEDYTMCVYECVHVFIITRGIGIKTRTVTHMQGLSRSATPQEPQQDIWNEPCRNKQRRSCKIRGHKTEMGCARSCTQDRLCYIYSDSVIRVLVQGLGRIMRKWMQNLGQNQINHANCSVYFTTDEQRGNSRARSTTPCIFDVYIRFSS